MCGGGDIGTMIEILKFIQTFQPSHDQSLAGSQLHIESLESNIKENVVVTPTLSPCLILCLMASLARSPARKLHRLRLPLRNNNFKSNYAIEWL